MSNLINEIHNSMRANDIIINGIVYSPFEYKLDDKTEYFLYKIEGKHTFVLTTDWREKFGYFMGTYLQKDSIKTLKDLMSSHNIIKDGWITGFGGDESPQELYDDLYNDVFNDSRLLMNLWKQKGSDPNNRWGI